MGLSSTVVGCPCCGFSASQGEDSARRRRQPQTTQKAEPPPFLINSPKWGVAVNGYNGGKHGEHCVGQTGEGKRKGGQLMEFICNLKSYLSWWFFMKREILNMTQTHHSFPYFYLCYQEKPKGFLKAFGPHPMIKLGLCLTFNTCRQTNHGILWREQACSLMERPLDF